MDNTRLKRISESIHKDTVVFKGGTSLIHHFYDLYFLYLDEYCNKFINSGDFRVSFDKLWTHDQVAFNEPAGWNGKSCMQSPLISDFTGLWIKLKSSYFKELSALAFSNIPVEKNIADVFVSIMKAF